MNMFQKILTKLKLDKHHRIERFGVMLLTLSILMSGLLASIVVKKTKDDALALSVRAMYTTHFTTSVTGISGDVVDVYRSDDGTRIFVLLKFSDAAKISTDADTYQLFLTGSTINMKQQSLANNPSGSIYSFGSTGYVGLYLTDDSGFPKQIYDLVVRCNRQITQNEYSTTSAKPDEDESFLKYDQFRIYFNPGGDKASQVDCLNGSVLKASDVYNELIIGPKEKDVRDTLAKNLKTMQTDLTAIKEYTERLNREGVTPVAAPELVSGDSVISVKDDILHLKTDHVIATGYDFEWRNKHINTGGYIDQLMEDGEDYNAFFTRKNAEVNAISFSTSAVEWERTDGTTYDSTGSSDADTNAAINNDISLLTTAWQTYYNDKSTYQCKSLKALLLLDVESKDAATNYTVRSEDGTLTKY